jgi:hypothetical protein
MFRICDKTVNGETMNDTRYRVLQIRKRVEMAAKSNRMFGGENGMGSIRFHNTVCR